MKSLKSHSLTIEDAEDGSGDGILTFPDEMIKELGWYEGMTLKMRVENKNGTPVLIINPIKNEEKSEK
jgi:hypothetical protein